MIMLSLTFTNIILLLIRKKLIHLFKIQRTQRSSVQTHLCALRITLRPLGLTFFRTFNNLCKINLNTILHCDYFPYNMIPVLFNPI